MNRSVRVEANGYIEAPHCALLRIVQVQLFTAMWIVIITPGFRWTIPLQQSVRGHIFLTISDISSVGVTKARKHAHLIDFSGWQGGSYEVPYERIKEDAKVGRFDIVRPEAIPPEVPYVENPHLMPDEHVAPWISFLAQCDRAQIPEPKRFQYARPQPDGPEVTGYQALRAPSAQMEYGPEAHSYALFIQSLEEAEPKARQDGLPLFYAGDPFYVSINPNQQDFWRQRLTDNSYYIELLDALGKHDKARPFQVCFNPTRNVHMTYK